MYSTDRAELRAVFFRAWCKHRSGVPLEGVETLIVETALHHPEYHAILDRPEQQTDRDYLPAFGETNPFVHMGLHIAVAEQLSIDQPPGVRDYFQRLRARLSDPHSAEHRHDGVSGRNAVAGATIGAAVGDRGLRRLPAPARRRRLNFEPARAH